MADVLKMVPRPASDKEAQPAPDKDVVEAVAAVSLAVGKGLVTGVCIAMANSDGSIGTLIVTGEGNNLNLAAAVKILSARYDALLVSDHDCGPK